MSVKYKGKAGLVFLYKKFLVVSKGLPILTRVLLIRNFSFEMGCGKSDGCLFNVFLVQVGGI